MKKLKVVVNVDSKEEYVSEVYSETRQNNETLWLVANLDCDFVWVSATSTKLFLETKKK